MAPTVIFIRHAEAEHNVGSRFYLPDPSLSERGVQQCRDLEDHLQKNLPDAHKVELIITSPFRRTLQTTKISLDWLIKQGVSVVPRAEWQENSEKPCDTGSDLGAISKEFPDLDFSSVDPMFPAKSGPYAYTEEAVLQRGADALAWIRARPEAVIAVVTHSAFLRTSVLNRRVANADYRVFKFSDAPGSIEMEEVTGEAGGMGRSAVGVMGIENGDFQTDYEKGAVKPAN